MAKTRIVHVSFSGGEVSPEMFGRIDDPKYRAGMATMRNFIAVPQGPAENRPGFEYVSSTKGNGVARLIPFIFSPTQTMVIELGDHYVRFHTQGETLEYDPATLDAWVPPSPTSIAYTLTSPGIITWTAHGLSTGDPIRFYIVGSTPDPLPGGLTLGYTYTVDVIDANTFNIRDADGNLVALTYPPGGGGSIIYTNHPGSGSTSVSLTVAPNQSGSAVSSTLGGLPSVPTTLGPPQVNVNFSVSLYAYQGGGAAVIEYYDGTNWNSFYGASSSQSATTISHSVNLTNINLLQLRISLSGGAGPAGSVSISASINSWSVDVPTGGTGATTANLSAYRYYTAGDSVSYGGTNYVAVKNDAGGTTTPGTDPSVWSALPAGGIYEIPSNYAAADLFDIHYTQSADVMTLVHPNYPATELERLGATSWKLTPAEFTPAIDPPANVQVTPSPGYKVQIATIVGTLITTSSNHTLSLGDGVYIDNLIATISGGPVDKSGFYIVSDVPINTGTGALIPNELRVMDYNGTTLDATGWSGFTGSPTIQLGDKVFSLATQYVVTAVAQNGIDESPISAAVSATNNLDVPGAYNTITWDPVPGALRYQVYKQRNGLYGYIGETTGTTFTDDNIAADFSITPPNYDIIFAGPGDYPSAVTYYEQRKFFGGTLNAPQSLWGSNSGTENTFSYSLPVKDTDRIAITVSSREANTIRHIVPLAQLLLLTSSAEIRISPANSDVLTPTTVSAKPQSYVGANNVQPQIVNNALLYCAARGGHVRELGYSWQSNGFITGDVSLRAAHLFDNLTLVDMAYQKAPRPIVWFVSSSGNLLGFTYVPEEQIGAWHQHDTDGVFESVACVPEGNEDRLYAVIRRTVNGATVRYIERMASRLIDPEDYLSWFFVDAGVSLHNSAPVTTVSGLTWLEGATVAVLADGGVQIPKVVTAGAITLDHSASDVVIGLPIVADLETLPLIADNADGYGTGRTKNINKVWAKLWETSGIWVGPDENNLTQFKQRTSFDALGSPPALVTRETEPIVIEPQWQQAGQVLIRQTDPLPVTVVGLTLEVSLGG